MNAQAKPVSQPLAELVQSAGNSHFPDDLSGPEILGSTPVLLGKTPSLEVGECPPERQHREDRVRLAENPSSPLASSPVEYFEFNPSPQVIRDCDGPDRLKDTALREKYRYTETSHRHMPERARRETRTVDPRWVVAGFRGPSGGPYAGKKSDDDTSAGSRIKTPS